MKFVINASVFQHVEVPKSENAMEIDVFPYLEVFKCKHAMTIMSFFSQLFEVLKSKNAMRTNGFFFQQVDALKLNIAITHTFKEHILQLPNLKMPGHVLCVVVLHV